ncbi:hypothetical protein Hanom_Chr11g00975131 [Helianthus anomalus]
MLTFFVDLPLIGGKLHCLAWIWLETSQICSFLQAIVIWKVFWHLGTSSLL